MTTNMLSATAVLLLLAPLASAEEVAGKIGYMSGGLIARHADGSFNSVDVAKGQSGYANNQFVARLSETPKFMNVEKLPAENDNGAGNRNNSSILPPQNGCQVK